MEKLEPSSSLESGLLPCSWYIISRLLKFILVSTDSAVSMMKTARQTGSKRRKWKEEEKTGHMKKHDSVTLSLHEQTCRDGHLLTKKII